MKDHPWIDSETAARLKSELVAAFGVSGPPLEEWRFKLVREELLGYYPDDLLIAVPYVLRGFLRFGVRDSLDEDALDFVLLFLDIECRLNDELTGGSLSEGVRKLARSKEASVSGFSDRQAYAIRLWLEAVGACGVLFDQEKVNCAIEYWSRREGGRGPSGGSGDDAVK